MDTASADVEILAPTERSASDHHAYEDLPLPATLERGQLLFRILGAASIHVGPDLEVGPTSERMFSLLVVTALAPDHAVARSRLLELVWPDMDEAGARHSLRQHCYRLKQLGVGVDTTRTRIALRSESLAPCFALHRTPELFDQDVLKGHEPFGHLFAGWIPRHPPLRHWVEQQREGYHAEVRRILVPELRRLRDRAHWLECERWARTLLEFDPYNEDATLILAHALAMTGSRMSSTEVLDTYVRETGGTGTELGRRVEREQARILKSSRLVHDQSAAPRLIGRDDVLARLDELTMRALQGEAQIVQLLGPAGIGKTEVAYEATRRAIILGFARCIVRVSRPVGQIAHGTLSRLTRDLLQLPGALGCSPPNLLLLRQFAGLEPAPALNSLPDDEPAAPLTECLLELLTCLSEERPLFVFIDDLHFVDRTSRSALDSLFDLLYRARVLVLVTSHSAAAPTPERQRETKHRGHICLSPLEPIHARELAAEVRTASGNALTPEQAQRVADASDHTPLHIVTLARESLVTGIADSAPLQVYDSLTRQVVNLTEPACLSLRCIALAGGALATASLDRAMRFDFATRVRTVRELLDSGLVREHADQLLAIHEEVVAPALSGVSSTERQVIELQLARTISEQVGEQFDTELALTALHLAHSAGDTHLFLGLVRSHATRISDAGFFSGILRFIEEAVTLANSNEERRFFVALLAATASRAADWRLALRSTASLRTLRTSQSRVDHEVWLSELEATLGVSPRWSAIESIEQALSLAQEPHLALDLRVRATRLAMASASNLLEKDLAKRALTTLKQIHPESISSSDFAVEPLMQYHTVFGDLQLAASVASSIALPPLDAPQLAAWMRVYCNACFVLRFAGYQSEARSRFALVFESQQLRHNPGRRGFAAWQLSLLAIERDSIEEASQWAERLEELQPQTARGAPEIRLMLHRYRMEVLTTGNIAEPKPLLELISSENTHSSRANLYAKGLALQSKSVRANRSLLEPLLAESISALSQYGAFGGQDLVALSAMLVLEEDDRLPEAISLARSYVANRRERGPLLPSLSRLGSQLRKAVADASEALQSKDTGVARVRLTRELPCSPTQWQVSAPDEPSP